METLLVTGGAGFIGSTFVRQVLAEGSTRVVNLDKLTYAGNLDSLASVQDDPRHLFIQGDIADRDLVAALLRAYRPRAIVHLAAETHVDRSIDSPRPFFAANVAGTFELLEATRTYWQALPAGKRRSFRFLQVSTDEVYGSLGQKGFFHEDSPYAPSSPYATSKAAADLFVHAFHRTYGLPVLVTHCSNNYGPYQFPEKLIPLMILKVRAGEPLPVYGDGGNVRDWLHVGDHCRALQTVLDGGRPGEIYNIGGNAERTNLDAVKAICSVMDKLCPGLPHLPTSRLIRFVPDRPGHDRRYAVDTTKIRSELAWTPGVTFEEGIERTVIWYLSHPHWVEAVLAKGYQGQRLGVLPESA
jgi:dTDP-glucose 4,6-dehydratase